MVLALQFKPKFINVVGLLCILIGLLWNLLPSFSTLFSPAKENSSCSCQLSSLTSKDTTIKSSNQLHILSLTEILLLVQFVLGSIFGQALIYVMVGKMSSIDFENNTDKLFAKGGQLANLLEWHEVQLLVYDQVQKTVVTANESFKNTFALLIESIGNESNDEQSQDRARQEEIDV